MNAVVMNEPSAENAVIEAFELMVSRPLMAEQDIAAAYRGVIPVPSPAAPGVFIPCEQEPASVAVGTFFSTSAYSL